eukprot:gene40696-331_t
MATSRKVAVVAAAVALFCTWEMLKLMVVHRGDVGKIAISLNKAHGRHKKHRMVLVNFNRPATLLTR